MPARNRLSATLMLVACWMLLNTASAADESAPTEESAPASGSGPENPAGKATATEEAEGETEPLWEWRLATFARYGESYPASENSQFNIIPFPLPVYRGKVLRIGEDSQNPIRGRLIRTDRIKLDLAFDLNFPVDSEDVTARTGMPDLDFQVEVGPELEIEFSRSKTRGSWFISPQLRPSFVFDSVVPKYQGVVFSPELIYKKKLLEGDGDMKVSLMPTLASSKYMDFFYTVDPSFAAPGRPAYSAEAGYLGTDLTARWKSSFKNNFAYVAGARVSFYQGAANRDSPLYTQETTFSIFGAFLWKFYESEARVPATGD
jgi:outer membrane protein